MSARPAVGAPAAPGGLAVRCLALACVALAFPAGGRAQATPEPITTPGRDSTRAALAAEAPGGAIRFLPVIGSAPETGLQLGALALRVSRPRGAAATARPTTDRLVARVTTRSQFAVEYERDAWFAGDRWRLLTRAEYSRFPLAWYGRGADAPASAKETYTPSTVFASILGQRRLTTGLYAGLGWTIADTRLSRLAPGGALAAGTIPGSRGGRLATVDLSLVADTRDNVYAARRGHLVTAQWSPARQPFGSEFTYSRTLLDARLFRPLPLGASVAVQGVIDDVRGGAPFDRLPTIGTSSAMRAYEFGRYRDPTLVAAQVELRRDLPYRLAGALWLGAGTVARSLGAVGDARLLPSYGLGGRWYVFPRERLAVRGDLAFGRGATGIYIGIGEAF